MPRPPRAVVLALATPLFIIIVSALAVFSARALAGLGSVQPTPSTSAVSATRAPATEITGSSPRTPVLFDGKHAYDAYLMPQVNFGVRPAGSIALRATGDFILGQLAASGWQTNTQSFIFRGVPIRNIIARTNIGQGPLVILGAHYDTRPRADADQVHPDSPILGANDGASGVAVLLELARTLDRSRLRNEVWLAFFDAEDNGGLDACALRVAPAQDSTSPCETAEWPWSVGAEHVAANLPSTPRAVVVLDMIGDADQNLYYEHNSDPALNTVLWRIAGDLGYRQWFIPQDRWPMTDDHTPFLNRHIRAVDLIDFDYPPWHTTADTADKVSPASLERVGRVIQAWLQAGAPIQ